MIKKKSEKDNNKFKSIAPKLTEKEYGTLIDSYPTLKRLLAQIIANQKYRVILGNGCSMSCGVPSYNTLRIKLTILLSGNGFKKNSLSQALDIEYFEKLWDQAGPSFRKTVMEELIPKRPMHLDGYYPLASAIKDNTFDRILTYNYDNYLETALHSIGKDDFLCFVNKCHQDKYMLDSLDRKGISIIYKIHGDSLNGIFAMTAAEVFEFDRNMSGIVNYFTKHKVIIFGYSASDYPFMRDIDVSQDGEDIWYINPAEPPDYLKQIMKLRNSKENHIKMEFGDFAEALHIERKRYGQVKTDIKTRGTEEQSNIFRMTLINKLGLHAKAAAKISALCRRYSSDVTLCKDHDCVDAKSILGMLMLAAEYGEEIEVRVFGPDQVECVAAIKDLFRRKFDEEE